ncbi:MAG: CoA transferase [Actinobacteria bacterium]|nr:CoA transferase [Actinomycetota bacterium]
MLSALFEQPTTVVEIGESISGSYCGRLLRQLGANVIKVEPEGGSPLRNAAPYLDLPSGGHLSATYFALNDGKTVVTADADTSAGRQAIGDLLRDQADIVVMSGELSLWSRRGLAPADVLTLAPKAVIGRSTLFGDIGPYVDIVGGELQAQALGGLMNMVGEPPREPLRMGGYQAQYSTGFALLDGFALGLYQRERTGRGCSFSTSVIETVTHIEWKGAVSYQADHKIVTRGSDGAPAILRAKDGFFAFFYRPDDWERVLTIMDDDRLRDPRFETQKGRDENRPALLEILNDSAGRLPKRELYHRTQAGKMTTGYTATMSDLLESEQYTARDFFETIDVPGLGQGRLPGAPWRVAASQPAAPAADEALNTVGG